jgi:hypothetical protein
MEEGKLAFRKQSSVNKVAFPWWCIICCPRFINKIRQVKKIYLAYKHGI